MEYRVEYNLTLSTPVGRMLVKAIVDYVNGVMESIPNYRLPTVFEVPGVLRIDNLVLIESHEYSVVQNPIYAPRLPEYVIVDKQRYPGRRDPRQNAISEEDCLNVKFVAWQRTPESVNTQHE